MTSYSKDIDKTEANAGNGNVTSMEVDTAGVTAGDSLKLSSGKVTPCTAITDVFYGIAAETKASGYAVKVLRSGCLVKTGLTLTADGYVEPSTSGTLQDYTSGTKVGIVEVSATSASKVRIL